MKKLIRVLKVRQEVKAQMKVVSYLKYYNQMHQSDEIEIAIGAIDYWLKSKVAGELLK